MAKKKAVKKEEKWNIFAILGFIFAFLSQVISIIFCAIALHQLKTKKEKGHGLAMAGLIISIIVLAVIVIGAILAVIFWGILRPHGIS